MGCKSSSIHGNRTLPHELCIIFTAHAVRLTVPYTFFGLLCRLYARCGVFTLMQTVCVIRHCFWWHCPRGRAVSQKPVSFISSHCFGMLVPRYCAWSGVSGPPPSSGRFLSVDTLMVKTTVSSDAKVACVCLLCRLLVKWLETAEWGCAAGSADRVTIKERTMGQT